MLAGISAWFRRWIRPQAGGRAPGAGGVSAPHSYAAAHPRPGQAPATGHRRPAGEPPAPPRGAPGLGGPVRSPVPPAVPPASPGQRTPGRAEAPAGPRFTPAPPPQQPRPASPNQAAGRDQHLASFPAAAPSRVVPPATAGDAAWVPAGYSAQVGRHVIPGGLLYVGSGLAAEKGGQPEPSLIDHRLPVDQRAPDYTGAKMGYWPSYSAIAPQCRAAYLHWLLDGRRAPGVYIGYVFLYFYGLERRLLVDSQSSPAARAEHAALVREVGRPAEHLRGERLLQRLRQEPAPLPVGERRDPALPVRAARTGASLGAAVRAAARSRPARGRRQAGARRVGASLGPPAPGRLAADTSGTLPR